MVFAYKNSGLVGLLLLEDSLLQGVHEGLDFLSHLLVQLLLSDTHPSGFVQVARRLLPQVVLLGQVGRVI